MKAAVPALLAAVLISCASNPIVPPASESAGEYRGLQSELHRQQADIAIVGQRIEDQGRGLADDLTRLEEMIAATPNAGEADRLVQAARVKAEGHIADIEDLNRQLAAERETARKQYQKFNEYEAVMTGRLSDSGAENAKLREEVKATKGQRNTLLGIFITAAVIVLIFVAFKVLRLFRVF
jgi:hypothetical protein